MRDLLPFLFLLACPVMMRGGHGGDGNHVSAQSDDTRRLEELEREVARLRSDQRSREPSEPGS